MHIKPKIMALMGMNPTGDLGPLTVYTSRRAGIVWFPKSPPLTPPTPRQLTQRNRFRCAARAWRALDEATREDWHEACTGAALDIHGYNLWIFWQITRDNQTIATIERISRITLIT